MNAVPVYILVALSSALSPISALILTENATRLTENVTWTGHTFDPLVLANTFCFCWKPGESRKSLKRVGVSNSIHSK